LPEKWNEALDRVHDKVGHFLSRLMPWDNQEHSPERISDDILPPFSQLGSPLPDMHETDDELIVRAELPRLKKDEFSVELVGRRLTIQGEKNVVRERKGGDGCSILECRYGSFARSVQLPYEIVEKSIDADLKHGVLSIRLPKPEKVRHLHYRVPVC
jgi:HSP20 family protein